MGTANPAPRPPSLPLVALGLAAVLLTAPTAAAKPTFAEQSDRLVLGNELVLVTFQGKKPMLEVRDATNASRGYKVFLQGLAEVPRGAALTGNEVVATFDWTAAQEWQVSHTTDAAGVHLTLHREGPLDVRRGAFPELPVPLPGGVRANATAGNASVTLVFHLYEQARTMTVGNETVSVTTHEVKFDLIVERWDWVSRGDVLALEFLLVDRMDDDNATRRVPPGTDANEAPVVENGTRIGWVGWASQAEAMLNGTATMVDVEHQRTGAAQAQGEPRGAKHWLVYDAPGFDNLTHDPSVGVEPTNPQGGPPGLANIPAPGALALLVAAPAAALLLRRRR